MPAGHLTVTLPTVVCVIGPSGAGKTTLIEAIVPILARRGLTVATAKHHHRLLGAPPGGSAAKDTDRHRAAGAAPILLVAADGVVLEAPLRRAPSLRSLVARYLAGADLVLAEGFSGSGFPKVAVPGPAGMDSKTYRGRLLATVGPGPREPRRLARILVRRLQARRRRVSISMAGPFRAAARRQLVGLAAVLGPGELDVLFRPAQRRRARAVR